MEPAIIDWDTIDSKFVEDEIYEHINAPKWIDFFAPDQHVDDETWFCKPDCRHPKTVEDFIRSTPPLKVKHMRAPTVSETLPLRNRNLRDANIKRGGIPSPSSEKKLNKLKMCKSQDQFQEDGENENPNHYVSLNDHCKNNVKQGMEKRKPFDKSTSKESSPPKEERRPKLKSTLSASNLFAGREIMSHITEFCNELKKLVMRAKERERRSPKKKLSGESSSDDGVGKEKENKPLLEVKKVNSEVVKKGIVLKESPEVVKKGSEKQKQRKLKTGEIENIQVQLPTVTGNGQRESLLQVRTCPPSPQCFSAYCEPLRRTKATTPLKPSKSIATDNGVLQEIEESNRMEPEWSPPVDKANNKNIAAAGKEARSLEMFWLLKPCTLSS